MARAALEFGGALAMASALAFAAFLIVDNEGGGIVAFILMLAGIFMSLIGAECSEE